MTGLSQTAENILELIARTERHPDPSVNRVILKSDIEDLIYRSEALQYLERQVEDMDYSNRQLEEEIKELKKDY